MGFAFLFSPSMNSENTITIKQDPIFFNDLDIFLTTEQLIDK